MVFKRVWRLPSEGGFSAGPGPSGESGTRGLRVFLPVRHLCRLRPLFSAAWGSRSPVPGPALALCLCLSTCCQEALGLSPLTLRGGFIALSHCLPHCPLLQLSLWFSRAGTRPRLGYSTADAPLHPKPTLQRPPHAWPRHELRTSQGLSWPVPREWEGAPSGRGEGPGKQISKERVTVRAPGCGWRPRAEALRPARAFLLRGPFLARLPWGCPWHPVGLSVSHRRGRRAVNSQAR